MKKNICGLPDEIFFDILSDGNKQFIFLGLSVDSFSVKFEYISWIY